MRVLVGCECSGVVREAFCARGYDAYSCDTQPCEQGSSRHLQADIREVINEPWDLAILHPPCLRLCNSGVRWLSTPPPGRTLEQMHRELQEGAALFSACWNARIPYLAVENPVMHKHAKALIDNYAPPAQFVQPWWFGEEAFKATGLYLKNLPLLRPTQELKPPLKGSHEHVLWTRKVHNLPRNANRSADRSRTFEGLADAMAQQWGDFVQEQLWQREHEQSVVQTALL